MPRESPCWPKIHVLCTQEGRDGIGLFDRLSHTILTDIAHGGLLRMVWEVRVEVVRFNETCLSYSAQIIVLHD